MIPEPAPLPCDDGGRLDEHEGLPPARPPSGEPRPEQAISDPGAGPGAATLVNGELVAQGEDLKVKGGPRLEGASDRGEEGEKDRDHWGSAAYPAWAAAAPARADRHSSATPLIPVASVFLGRTRRDNAPSAVATGHPRSGDPVEWGPHEVRWRHEAERGPAYRPVDLLIATTRNHVCVATSPAAGVRVRLVVAAKTSVAALSFLWAAFA